MFLASQYGPNIANFILTHAPFNTSLNLKGIAQGNAVCRRPDENLESLDPNGGQDDLDMYWCAGTIGAQPPRP